MKRLRLASVIVLFVAASGIPIAAAHGYREGRTLQVAITNVTRGQVVSPPLLVTHRPGLSLFEPGAPAGEALAALAEDGSAALLAAVLEGDPAVFDVVTGEAPIPPGETLVLEIRYRGRYNRLSAAGMLVSTNDAFFALEAAPIPFGAWGSFPADAYDAGSEANNEDCGFIPGPPCGNPGVRETDGAEGFVHVHGGVHGIGDLPAEDFDWRNPVVEIRILRPAS
jgi:hypothetical protein